MNSLRNVIHLKMKTCSRYSLCSLKMKTSYQIKNTTLRHLPPVLFTTQSRTANILDYEIDFLTKSLQHGLNIILQTYVAID